jgi:hypothetical protein
MSERCLRPPNDPRPSCAAGAACRRRSAGPEPGRTSFSVKLVRTRQEPVELAYRRGEQFRTHRLPFRVFSEYDVPSLSQDVGPFKSGHFVAKRNVR